MEQLIRTFLKAAFGSEAKGVMCIAVLQRDDKKRMVEHYFQYPEEIDRAAALAVMEATISDVYYCPQLFEGPQRRKDNVKSCPTVWADLDTCHPNKMLVPPNIVVESSPGRWQGLWTLAHPVASIVAEDISRRIAYHHADDGADRSGWDLTQLLRLPGTFNHKYSGTVEVKLRRVDRALYVVRDFAEYPEVKHSSFLSTPFPKEDELPKEAPADIMQKYNRSLVPAAFDLFNVEPDGEWSERLWRLEMLLLEGGLSREQVFVVAWDAACNKYRRDNKNPEYLWIEICRAWVTYQERINATVFPGTDMSELLTAEEEKEAKGRVGFVERYIEWASSLGDAAVQYHQAGAFTILSALLAGHVTLPTSYGRVVPNLWFMILGDTTLTRKSTAMDLAIDLLMDVDPDCVLATDGSVEGLMQGLSTRPKRPSIFLRDEFSGLLEMINKRDYYAGMAEVLTKLYDGKMQKRILRREEVTVRDPILLIFAGGIRTRVQSLLTTEHVSSGFMPRFLFITAESDPSKLRALGPPTGKVTGNRSALVDETVALLDHYGQSRSVYIRERGERATAGIDADLTADAWDRYNQLERDLLESGVKSEKPELMTPLFDRLAKSILKAAVLLAAARQVGQEGVRVTKADILHAIRYGQQWREYAIEIVNGVGKTTYERDLERVLAIIVRRPGISRGQLMQSYHLTAKQMTAIADTLIQREQVQLTRLKTGGVVFYPIVGGAK